MFGHVNSNLQRLVAEISSLDINAEQHGLSEEEVELIRSKFVDLWAALKTKETILRQKSKVKWIKEGDSNSSFFHASLVSRRRRNLLAAIQVDNLWVEEVNQIKGEVERHFSKIYMEDVRERPLLEGVQFQKLDGEVMRNLVALFSPEEVEEVVNSFEGNKSPGPDGFNFNFFQSFWDLLKREVEVMVNEFFVHGKLPLGFSSYFVALIPKINNPQCLSKFRSISFLGSLYKIISKMLACRLKRVLDPIMSCNQSAFLKSRNILDGVVVINEVVDYARKSKKKEIV